MKKDHKAVVALRKVAVEWAAAMHTPARDSKDSAFARIDRKLQRAAIKYAEAVRCE